MTTTHSRLLPFVAVACALVALLFVDAASGRVLAQSDILLRHSPWFEHRPPVPGATNDRQPGNPLLGDVPLFVYPSLDVARNSLREFRLPLWNPAMYGGQPFLASYQAGVLSPFVLLTVLFAPADALLAHAVARLLLGGIGMFLFLRGLGLAPPAVWFGGLSFLLNPFTMVWLLHPPSAVSGWLPWLLWAVDRTRRHAGAGNVALLAGLIAMTLLAGHPETAFKVLLMTGAYSLAVCLVGTTRDRWRADGGTLLGRLLPAALLGAALAGAQIVPFVEYMGESGIAALRRTFTVSPLIIPPPAAAAAFVPDLFGNPARGDTLAVRNRAGAEANYLEQQVYPGNVAWILTAVAVAFATRRGWRIAFLAGTALLAGALMYGAPGVSRLFALIPMAGLSAPSRFGLLVIFAVITIGSIGVSALSESGRRRSTPADGEAPAPADTRDVDSRRATRAALAGLALMATFVTALIWWQWPLFRYGAFVPDMARAVAWSGGIACAAVGIVIAWANGRMHRRLAAGLLVGLAAADLFAFGFRFHPTLPRAQVFPSLPSIERIKGDRGLFRVAGYGNSLPPNTAMAYGLADPRGYDGVAPRLMTDLLGRAFGTAMAHQVDRHGALWVLDLLNVKYIVANDNAAPVSQWTPVATAPVTVFRNDRAFPRAWLVDRVNVMDDASALDWVVSATSDRRSEAPIPDALGPDVHPERSGSAGVGEARISRYEPTEVEITTQASGRRLLVLADAWYPGWEVYIDGRKASMVRAYYALRAVPVPAGRHVVLFAYEPASLTIGLTVSAGALLVLGVLIALASRQRCGPQLTPSVAETAPSGDIR